MGPADGLAESGLVAQALQEVILALRKLGPEANLYSHRARALFYRDRHAAAFRELQRGLKLCPRDTALHLQRSDYLVQLNRHQEARESLRKAAALVPGNESLPFAGLRQLLFGNNKKEAFREISRILRRGSAAAVLRAIFYRGCFELKAGDWESAERDFGRVVDSLKPDDNLSMRARFYRLLARATDPRFQARRPMARDPEREARLHVCGLGLFPPYTATLDVVGAIRRCDVVFNNVIDDETREFLAVLCDDVRPLTFDVRPIDGRRVEHHREAAFWTRQTSCLVRQGRVVGYITRGHPLVYGGLGAKIQRQCGALGIESRIFASVSAVDILAGSMGQRLGGDAQTVQVCPARSVERAGAIDPRHPLLVFFCHKPLKGRQARPFWRALRRHYPETHASWIFEPVYDMEPTCFPMAQMERRFPTVDKNLVLYVPGVR